MLAGLPSTSRFCAYELIAEQAGRTPDALALTNGARSYTYAQLETLTNQLAHYLISQGVQPETIVGCWLHSSLSTAIYMLAILKAGGAYLLLDPKLPSARLRYLVDDAEPLCIIADRTPPAMFATGKPLLRTQQALRAAKALPSSAPGVKIAPETLAYLAYTSGSTGRPKGVLITHGAVANHTRAFLAALDLKPGDRSPLMAPLAFDMATEEMLPPLAAGCTLVDAPPKKLTMQTFTDSIIAHRYTFLNLPAPLWHQWVAYLHDSQRPVPADLRLVVVGSDKIYTKTLREWLALPGAHHVRWIAAYGVTETTITSTLYTTAADDDLTNEPLVPIGKPIQNVTIAVMNANGQPVRQGQKGELYIGGAGVARGYHKLPEKTALNFVPDTHTGHTLYKTGDVVRQRPEGSLVWLGRSDSQIKRNGMRIELAEIEAVLHEFPATQEAVVTFVPSTAVDGDGQLIAYVQAKQGLSLDTTHLQHFLASRLHQYMVPNKLIVIDHMPLNHSGKLDRKLLQERALQEAV